MREKKHDPVLHGRRIDKMKRMPQPAMPPGKTAQAAFTPGCATQFSPPGRGGKCDIVIGFDFGTSCTKVILRSPYHYGGRAFAVPFAEAAHNSSPHLLPSVLLRFAKVM